MRVVGPINVNVLQFATAPANVLLVNNGAKRAFAVKILRGLVRRIGDLL